MVIRTGLELLGDSLSPDEVAQLFPTGHQQIDILLAKHPQLSKSDRLARLLADIPFTRTASEWVRAGKPALLTLLERSEQDFTRAEYRPLYNFLYGTEWRVDFEEV